MAVKEIGPRELQQKLASFEMPIVLDVREPGEIRLAPFAGALEIPLGELQERIGEIDASEDIVVLCHHGIRSARVASYLVEQGFQRVTNLAGGIDAWSVLVDPSVPRY